MPAWLIDKSALVRLAASPEATEWAARIERGLVRITTVTRLETGYSARSGPELRTAFQQPPLSSMPVESLTPRHRGPGSRDPGPPRGPGPASCSFNTGSDHRR